MNIDELAAGAVGASGCRALWEISAITNCDPPPLECANQNQEGRYL